MKTTTTKQPPWRQSSSTPTTSCPTCASQLQQHNKYYYPQRGGGGGTQQLLCANCGCYGHVYRVCNQPVSSFGVICYRTGSDGEREYLMVQRKDSLSFVEFIRGKYNVQNRGYLLRLLANMTTAERELLATQTFDQLWQGFCLYRQFARPSSGSMQRDR
jgi:hypothetical protein